MLDTEYQQRATTGLLDFKPFVSSNSMPCSGRSQSKTSSVEPSNLFSDQYSMQSRTATADAHIKHSDDISDIMMQGAADLRNTKLEVEELVSLRSSGLYAL